VSAARSKGTVDTLRELWDLLRSYAIQETFAPLRSLGRSLGWGLFGAVFVGLSVVLAGLGLLRLLQSETGVFDDRLSWLPYLIVMVVMAVVIGGAVAGIARTRRPASPNGRKS